MASAAMPRALVWATPLWEAKALQGWFAEWIQLFSAMGLILKYCNPWSYKVFFMVKWRVHEVPHYTGDSSFPPSGQSPASQKRHLTMWTLGCITLQPGSAWISSPTTAVLPILVLTWCGWVNERLLCPPAMLTRSLCYAQKIAAALGWPPAFPHLL